MTGQKQSKASSCFGYINPVAFLQPKPHAVVYNPGTNVVKVQTDNKVHHGMSAKPEPTKYSILTVQTTVGLSSWAHALSNKAITTVNCT